MIFQIVLIIYENSINLKVMMGICIGLAGVGWLGVVTNNYDRENKKI